MLKSIVPNTCICFLFSMKVLEAFNLGVILQKLVLLLSMRMLQAISSKFSAAVFRILFLDHMELGIWVRLKL